MAVYDRIGVGYAAVRRPDPRWEASIHAALGDREETLSWLEQAVEEAASLTCFTKAEPGFAFVRKEPRFVALLQKMGAV